MIRSIYHVVPVGHIWGVRRERRERAGSVHFKKTDAIAQAKRLARAAPLGQVKVHGRNGLIQLEFTYREDPHRPRG
jgi:hypothetical protein